MQSRLAVCLLALMLCCGAPQATAKEIVIAKEAVSGDEIALADGGILRLKGIIAAFPGGLSFLNQALSTRELRLTSVTTDRYGRIEALAASAAAPESLQESLLKEGLALVFSTEAFPEADRLLAAEQAARSARRGYWASSTTVAAKNAEAHLGKYGIFTGTVSKTERIKNKIQVSFEDPASPPLTVLIAAKHLRALKKRGMDPLTLTESSLRVRGWVEETETGPTIILTAPFQLERANDERGVKPPRSHKSGEESQTQD